MSLRPILTFPNPVLRQKAKKISEFDSTLDTLITDMVETMYDAPGVGLAAPQIGESIQLIVLDVTEDDEDVRLLPRRLLDSDERLDVVRRCAEGRLGVAMAGGATAAALAPLRRHRRAASLASGTLGAGVGGRGIAARGGPGHCEGRSDQQEERRRCAHAVRSIRATHR